MKGLVGAVFRDAHARIVGSLALLDARAIAVRLAVAAKAIVALCGERSIAILVVAVDGHFHNGALVGYGAHGAIEVACGVVEGAPHAGCLVERPLTVVVERVCSHHDVETIQRELNRRIYVDSHIRHGSQEVGSAADEARDKRQARRNRGDATAFGEMHGLAAFLGSGAPGPFWRFDFMAAC